MALRVYNSLTDQKEPFRASSCPGKVGMYLCGPTVYKSPHIGHMVGPVIFDAIKRYLTFKGTTSRGSSTSPTSTTSSSTPRASRARRCTALAERYTQEYLECLRGAGRRRDRPLSQGVGAHAARSSIDDEAADREAASRTRPKATSGSTSRKTRDYGKLSNRKVEEQESRHARARGQRASATPPTSPSGKPPSPASRSGIRHGDRAGRAGTSSARP